MATTNVTITQIKEALNTFISDVILPRSTPLMQGMIHYFKYMNDDKINQGIIKLTMPDENGVVDFERVFNGLKHALTEVKGDIILPYLEWKVDMDDLTSFYNILKSKCN